jgi:hypothetical protein
VTSPKQPGRKTRRRTPPSSKRPPKTPQPARAFAQQAALTTQWFDAWRRANTLGWDYLNAVSGLFRANMSALTDATRLMPPFPPLQ